MSDVIKPRPGMNVSIKVGSDSLPQGGNTGDVLTKTESGAEWQKPTGGAAGVQTVNGIKPDENGNVNIEIPEVEIPEVDLSGVVRFVNGAAPDENGNVVFDIPDIELPEVDLSGVVKSVNGISPDGAGNVAIDIPQPDLTGFVKTVNNAAPDAAGNVTLNASDVGALPNTAETWSAIDDRINAAIGGLIEDVY